MNQDTVHQPSGWANDLRTRRDVGGPECQKDPIFLFQRKSGKHWETEWVFFTREEGEEYGQAHAYNYRGGWRVFCVSALGELADVLRMPERQAGPLKLIG